VARTAEYSIKGYVYQFLRYLSDILAADSGTSITIEGAIEDIDIHATDATTAVQCKYHEQADKFTLGRIYKPILLMLEHFSKNPSTTPQIRYRLFCHFPEETGTRLLTGAELDTVLATTAVGLAPIKQRIAAGVDHAAFLRRLEIEFGPSVEALQTKVLTALKDKGFSGEDVAAIIYPAAFQQIVDIATRDTVVARTLDPVQFLSGLKDVRRVTFTRWTRELATRAHIFKRLRSDLKDALGQNSRGRHFVIDPSAIADFDQDIVRFIRKFVEKYSAKYLHMNPPLFTVTGDYDVGALQVRLHDAGLKCATGLVGNAEIRVKDLFRKPMRQQKPQFLMEFRLRLAAAPRWATSANSGPMTCSW